MDRLTPARRYFSAHGRDIDRALFDYHFGAASMEELLAVLGRYQNPDGGFGNDRYSALLAGAEMVNGEERPA